jgi:hypothetical protein
MYNNITDNDFSKKKIAFIKIVDHDPKVKYKNRDESQEAAQSSYCTSVSPSVSLT